MCWEDDTRVNASFVDDFPDDNDNDCSPNSGAEWPWKALQGETALHFSSPPSLGRAPWVEKSGTGLVFGDMLRLPIPNIGASSLALDQTPAFDHEGGDPGGEEWDGIGLQMWGFLYSLEFEPVAGNPASAGKCRFQPYERPRNGFSAQFTGCPEKEKSKNSPRKRGLERISKRLEEVSNANAHWWASSVKTWLFGRASRAIFTDALR
ncbi:hypothetical protein B0H11DRAFT_1940148 [Mycena galericulata]|nr:hypothetical protein B0H11DRAFT_1940148 [Mycena galericulata]